MKFEVRVLKHFLNQFKKLNKKYPLLVNDIQELKEELALNPTLGESLGSNFYKIRINITGKSKGKSGGARIITYIYYKTEVIYLVAIYNKSKTVNITIQEIKKIFNINNEFQH